MQVILESGAQLRERYEILELVGQGGMGAVYKARDLRLEGRICAVKEILPSLTQGNGSSEELEQMSEQFRREASVLARLDHPNLPKVSDYFADATPNGTREYLVMDFVEGRDLQEILQDAVRRNEFLSETIVLGWAAQLLDALEYMHEQNPPVLHRDIKPSNIKLTPRGAIKLVDFGLVKVLQVDESRTVTVLQGRGTVAYTPLEQYGGDTGYTDARSDLYSLGATLYHLLAGIPPVDAKERFLHPGALTSLRQLNPAITPRCERAIFQSLSMHPNDRPANAAEMRGMLLGSLQPAALPTSALSAQPPLPEPAWGTLFRRHLLLVGTAIALLVAAVVTSLW
jgi:eukaryotic-like serine/threonine-protein kinase